MGRPKKNRVVGSPPRFSAFKPRGIPSRQLETVGMSLDEFEALRLADLEGLSQEEGAGEMEVSRATFARLLESARQKSAGLLVNGAVLVIEGGPVHFRENAFRCRSCGRVEIVGIYRDEIDCPRCGGALMDNLAEKFGHGRCCRPRLIPSAAHRDRGEDGADLP